MQRNESYVQGFGRDLGGVGHFYVDVAVRGRPDAPDHLSVRALVATGSEYTWLPADLLESLRVDRRQAAHFVNANGQQSTRDTGYAFLRVDAWETVDIVVFAEPGDATLLGAHTLEGFNANVDPVAKRLVPGPPLLVPANILVHPGP